MNLNKKIDFLAIRYSNIIYVNNIRIKMNRIYVSGLAKETKNKVIPCDIDQYYYLTSISITNSLISNLPTKLFSLNLKKIDLHYNYIKILPREIKNLSSLMILNIEYNLLSTLPREIFNLNSAIILYSNGNKFANTIGHSHNDFYSRLKYLDEYGFID